MTTLKTNPDVGEPRAWSEAQVRREVELQVAPLMEEIERLKSLADEPMRVIAVAAIREVTGRPDIKGNEKYLVDVLMEKVRFFVVEHADTYIDSAMKGEKW